MQAFKIQKNFRRSILKGCPIEVTNLGMCRNHLKLYLRLSKNIALDQFGLRLVKLIKASSANFEIKRKFLSFSKSANKIQRAWKAWIQFFTQLFHSFLSFWDEVTQELINYYNVKSKEKKKTKTQILVNLANIPPPVKEKRIKDYLKLCRKRRIGITEKNPGQVYIKDIKVFTKLVLESCLEKNIRVKKLPIIVLKKKPN